MSVKVLVKVECLAGRSEIVAVSDTGRINRADGAN